MTTPETVIEPDSRTSDGIEDSRVEIIAGAGHVPQWEQLDRVAPLVLDFLQGAA